MFGVLADRVILLDNGAVAATGTHDELLTTNPRYAAILADTDGEDEVALSGQEPTATQSTISNGVERLRPGRGTEAFAQESIEIDMAPGWRGELVLQPGSGDAIPLPDDEVEFTSLNQLIYQPGPGKAIERLPSGQVCVRATIWDQVRGRTASERVESWCFDVT